MRPNLSYSARIRICLMYEYAPAMCFVEQIVSRFDALAAIRLHLMILQHQHVRKIRRALTQHGATWGPRREPVTKGE